MMQQKAYNLVRGQRIPAPVHAANTVCVAVGYKAEVVRMPAQQGGATGIIGRNGLGVDTAEIGIVSAVQSRHAAGRAAEQLIETACADAKEGLVGEAQFRLGDEFEIDQFFNRLKMGRAKILQGDFPGEAVEDRDGAL